MEHSSHVSPSHLEPTEQEVVDDLSHAMNFAAVPVSFLPILPTPRLQATGPTGPHVEDESDSESSEASVHGESEDEVLAEVLE